MISDNSYGVCVQVGEAVRGYQSSVLLISAFIEYLQCWDLQMQLYRVYMYNMETLIR